jgi:LysR family glycine cleavage system transcriptional activator
MSSIDGLEVSDRALRIFATATRIGSLTGAAATLGIGQPAVSHAIKRLELQLSTTLLHRSRTGVRATSPGQALLDQIEPAFARIDEAIGAARQPGGSLVSLSVSTSLASWWLLPRLPDFKRSHPSISLRLVTADSDAAVDMGAIDLWIPLGRIERSDLDSVVLCREALIPVASPDLAERLKRDGVPLTEAPLLHLEERYEPRFDWRRWFDMHEIDASDDLAGDRSNDYSLVLQAALDGQGVALGWEHIVRDLIAEGRLIGLAAPVVTETPFVVLSSNRRRLSPEAAALRSWLVSELSRPSSG